MTGVSPLSPLFGKGRLAAPTIEVIIVNTDDVGDLRECVKALNGTDYPRNALCTLIVDNAGIESTRTHLDRMASDRISFLRVDERQSPTIAVNAGLRTRRHADFTVLLSRESRMPPDWLRRMLVPFLRHADVGLVGPLSNAASWQSVPAVRFGGKKWPVNHLPKGMKLADYMLHFDAIWAEAPTFPRVPFLDRCCLMVREAVFDKIGLFDEEAFPSANCEIDDFCFRAGDAGFGLMVAANAFVYQERARLRPPGARDDLHRSGLAPMRARYSEGRIERARWTMEYNPVLERIRRRLAELAAAATAGAFAGRPINEIDQADDAEQAEGELSAQQS